MSVKALCRLITATDHGAMIRSRFAWRAIVNREALARLAEAEHGTLAQEFYRSRPQIAWALATPYQCIAWSPAERLRRIESHCSIIDKIGRPLKFSLDEKVILLELDRTSDGVRIVLDQPAWMMREGLFALNLFQAEQRLFSLSFSLSQSQGVLEAFVGGMKGRSLPGVLDLYRKLTKDFHGLRPRDLLFEVFRTLCRQIQVERILSVTNEFAFSKDRYFGSHLDRAVSLNLDEIWLERGGIKIDPTSFEFSLTGQRKPLEEIPSKKRGIYGKRYDMLDQMDKDIRCGLNKLTPVKFDAK